MTRKTGIGLGIVIGISAMLLIAVAVWLFTVYTGGYNVAATDPHTNVVRWTFDTTMHRSIKDRASGLTPPERLSEETSRAGARIYAEACAHCHSAPGSEHEPWARHMRPQPPELAHAAADWKGHEIFWIVKHGIKMTGMPAFDPEYDDETIWGIAAFVKRLPGMTPEAYKAATRGANNHH